MINEKSDLRDFLDYEKAKYGISGITSFAKYLAGNETEVIWMFQRRLRITEYHKNVRHKVRYYINLLLLNYMRNKYGLHISLNVFDKGLRIMHLGSILTNDNVRVGKNCYVHINTAFVAQGVKNETPVLGNDIIVGVGATILGGVYIADGIAIGANAVVNKTFLEENIAVAGIPAKKVSESGSLRWNQKGE